LTAGKLLSLDRWEMAKPIVSANFDRRIAVWGRTGDDKNPQFSAKQRPAVLM